MPVIPQYQPSQTLNPQSGARFRAPDTPDLIGPALQQAAAQLKAAATEAEKRQALEDEAEGNRRMAKYESIVTGVLYGTPERPGQPATRGHLAMSGEAAISDRPNVDAALSDAARLTLDGLNPRQAEMVQGALTIASTKVERTLAANDATQAEVAAKGALEARTETDMDGLVARRAAAPEEYAAQSAKVLEGLRAQAERAGLGAEETRRFMNEGMAKTHVRAINALVADGRHMEAWQLAQQVGPGIYAAGEAAAQTLQRVEVGRNQSLGVQAADALIAANTTDGATDFGAVLTGVMGLPVEQQDTATARTNQARAAQTLAAEAKTTRATNEAIRLIGTGVAPAQFPPELQEALGAAGMNNAVSFYNDKYPGADTTGEVAKGGDYYHSLRELYRTNPEEFVRMMTGTRAFETLNGVTAEEANTLQGLMDRTSSTDPVDQAMTRAEPLLRTALVPLGLAASGVPKAKIEQYRAGIAGARRYIDQIVSMHGPGYAVTPREIEEAVDVGFLSTERGRNTGLGREARYGETTARLARFAKEAGLTLRGNDAVREALTSTADKYDGTRVVPYNLISVQTRGDIIKAIRNAGETDVSPGRIEQIFNDNIRRQLGEIE